MPKEKLKQIVDELLDTATPQQWINFLFDLQNSMIANSYFESLTAKGCRKHASYIYGLKEFFESINQTP